MDESKRISRQYRNPDLSFVCEKFVTNGLFIRHLTLGQTLSKIASIASVDVKTVEKYEVELLLVLPGLIKILEYASNLQNKLLRRDHHEKNNQIYACGSTGTPVRRILPDLGRIFRKRGKNRIGCVK